MIRAEDPYPEFCEGCSMEEPHFCYRPGEPMSFMNFDKINHDELNAFFEEIAPETKNGS